MIEKLKLPLLIFGLIIILIIILQVKSCIKEQNLTQVAKLQGQFDAYKTEAEISKADLLKAQEALKEEVAVRMDEITELRTESEENQAEIESQNSEIADLKAKFSLIPQEDKDAQILNLSAQITGLEKIIEVKDLEITNKIEESKRWEGLYNLQLDYTDKLEAQLRKTENLLMISQQINKKYESKIRGLKLGRTIERLATIPLAAYASYQLYKEIKK